MPAKAKAFYDYDSFAKVFQKAQKFSGHKGHVATSQDIASVRAKTPPGSYPWNTYFTTLSAEYFGFNHAGRKVIIVAHGVGPMATLDGIIRCHQKPFTKGRGASITQEEFLKLESGAYGSVSVVHWDLLLERYQYPMLETLTIEQTLTDPLAKARLGKNWKDCVVNHALTAMRWHYELGHGWVKNPYIISLSDSNSCFYNHTPLDGEKAHATLLTFGTLNRVMHEKARETGSFIFDIHGTDLIGTDNQLLGSRLVGVRGPTQADTIQPDSTSENLIRLAYEAWQRVSKPLSRSTAFS